MRYALFAGGLYAVPALPPPPPADWEAAADDRGFVFLPPGYGTLFLGAEKDGGGTAVRFRRGGEFLPWGRTGTRLQEFLRRRRVPPWLRGRVPLLFVDGAIRAVAPRWAEERWRSRRGTFLWMPESPSLVQALLDLGTDPVRSPDGRFSQGNRGGPQA